VFGNVCPDFLNREAVSGDSNFTARPLGDSESILTSGTCGCLSRSLDELENWLHKVVDILFQSEVDLNLIFQPLLVFSNLRES
jgi:hypothetical protein